MTTKSKNEPQPTNQVKDLKYFQEEITKLELRFMEINKNYNSQN